MLYVLVQLLFTSCEKNHDDVWEMLALGVPETVTPEIATINMGYYILKQTHEPLFRKNNQINQFQSNILSSWEAKSSFKSFSFCLKKKLMFTKRIPFSASDLTVHLKTVMKKNDIEGLVKSKGNCVEVILNQASPKFINIMSLYENAPSQPSTNQKIHYGLGPFVVNSLNATAVKLERKKAISNGYNKIHILAYKGKGDENLNNKMIEDFNRVYISDVPQWVKNGYSNYGVSLLQTINLILNIEDSNVRQSIYNCINIGTLRQALMPKQKQFKDIKTILPIGILGAKEGRPIQKCTGNSKLKSKYEGLFINWKKDSYSILSSYVASLNKKLGASIKLENIGQSELLKAIFQSPHPYDLVILALDSVRPDYAAYYEYFFKAGKSLIDIPLPELEKLYKNLKTSNKSAERLQYVDKINTLLQGKKVVLPLYQEVRRFYFPKRLKNIRAGRNFLEYPEIGEIRF